MQAAKSRKGSTRITEILRATLDLLAEDGYADISFTSVARRVGIAKGNLQYYFPTRDSLLCDALELQVDDLKHRWSRAFDTVDDPWARLDSMIDEDVKLSRSEIRKALALEKWAYASRDERARRIFAEWFEWIIDQHAAIVGALRPELSRTDRYRLATLVTSLVTGMWPLFGANRIRRPGMTRLPAAFKAAVRNLIHGYAATSG